MPASPSRLAGGHAGGVLSGQPGETREWVSFPDPAEDRTWMFDVSFLTSSWSCLYGDGCQGVLTAPAPELAQGCCSYGAHFTGEEDARRIEKLAASLPPELWQYRQRGLRRRADGSGGPLKRKPGKPITTRLADDACIFLNRPGFPAGAGCALHLAALADGVEPMEYKPEVCWQLPLRREDQVESSGHVVSRVTQWERRHWGPAGAEFAWWCSEDPAAYRAGTPVYQRMEPELRALCGDEVVDRLVDWLAARLQRAAPAPPGGTAATPLRAPTRRRRG